mmetsp:Transcript_79432/g.158604  ORF Transcript_79432/g.158604 Transcript_79432/m.158604 type:complete len:570 (+) Transcript_79432:39-1748(+)
MALPGMGRDTHFVTMSLGTRGASTMPNSTAEHFKSLKLGPSAGRPTNLVHDIDGAQPAAVYKNTNKPSFYEPKDIRGTTSKQLIRTTNAPDNTLRLDDIDGAQPRPYTFKTNRVVDPLLPAYKLPSATMAEPLEPKFIRDSYSVSDIQGTKSRPLYPLAQRHNHECSDIEGAQTGWRPRNQQARYDAPPSNNQLDVRDINNVGFKSTRVVDPLKPEYRVNGMVIRDDPKYTQPRPLPGPANHDFYSLKTNDIEGAWPGWVPPHECTPPIDQRRHFRNTNFVGDIRGAQADTVKHSIVTERVVNPLNPVYDSLDGDRLKPPLTPNILNGDPSKHGLGQPDAYKDGKQRSLSQPVVPQQGSQSMTVGHRQSASQPSSARSHQQQEHQQQQKLTSARLLGSARSSGGESGVQGKGVPGINLSAMRGSSGGGGGSGMPTGSSRNEAKDVEIARLEHELSSLKTTYHEGGGGGGTGRILGSARPQPQYHQQQQQQQMTFTKSSARGGSAQVSARDGGSMNVTQQMVSARGPPAASFAASARGSARSVGGGGSSARASARKSAALAADIASVREL